VIDVAIRRIVDGQHLGRDEMHEVFGEVMDGRATDVQKSALLIALRMKGETADEITGAASIPAAPAATDAARSTCRPLQPLSRQAPVPLWPSTEIAQYRHRAAAPTFSQPSA